MSELNTKIAVYGSLRKGLYNHGLIGDRGFIKKVEVKLPFKMISLGAFPALINSEEENNITLELYELDKTTFKDVDYLEGHPTFYRRQLIKIENSLYWIYILVEDRRDRNCPEIKHGNWVKFKQLELL